MKIVILPAARDDLADGVRFYEHQQEGLGNYFLKSLFSDIDSLTPFTTPRKREPCSSKPCWIVAGTRASTGESFIKLISKFRAFAALHLRVKPAKDKTQFRPARQKTTRPRFFCRIAVGLLTRAWKNPRATFSNSMTAAPIGGKMDMTL